MKIEFIKEQTANGETIYFTRVNGDFVKNTLSFDRETAKKAYETVVQNKGQAIIEEVIETVTI